MRKHNNKFITIEGIEGAGKSTVVHYIKRRLGEAGISFVTTREPGGTPIAEDIREVLLKDREEIMSPDTELLLFFAGRAQNISQVIIPALQRGQWVLSDRFTDASFAYQGSGRGVPLRHVRELADWVQGDLEIDLTLLLDVPVELGLERLKSRKAKDRIEKEGNEFFERARERYLIRAEKYPERFRVIDASVSALEVEAQIAHVIDPLIYESKACPQ